MDASKIRLQIVELERKRKGIIDKLLRPKSMISGYLYPMFKKCGKKGCRCERGEKHGPYWCISSLKDKKTHLKAIGKRDWIMVKILTDNYREYQKQMAELRRLHFQVWEMLKQLRDEKIKEYP